MTRGALLTLAAILLILVFAVIGYRTWFRPNGPVHESNPIDTTDWQPTPQSRLGDDPTFEFRYRRDGYVVDSRAGTVTRNAGAGPVARLRLSGAERDSIRRAILASGFFDWPAVLGTPHRTNIVPEIRDESELSVHAGRLDHRVTRVDTFGREDEPRANREAKRRMSDLERLIRGVVATKPEFQKLPVPPPLL
jgi:hypothetical protein